jgi:glycyl-tRNA synthetase
VERIVDFDKIVSLCKSRGFVYPGSEIYGGLANTWDYGPIGVELKNNIKKLWWKKFIQEQKFNVGIDSSILMNPMIWKASGHLDGFSDPLIDCKNCKARFRADKLLEEYFLSIHNTTNVAELTCDATDELISKYKIKCPECGSSDFTKIRSFNLMFKTFMGVTEERKNTVYLRPETAQGIFVNFNNVWRTTRKKLPFGIGQIGKSFRNEITPGNFIFRTREFEQMELEFFCEEHERETWFEFWKNFCYNFLLSLGLNEKNLRIRSHAKEELSHYSNATCDIEYNFSFGWGELWGIADRGSYDLSRHVEFSGQEINYFDSKTNKKVLPFCIEPSVGLDRIFLAILYDSYQEEKINDSDVRTVLKLNKLIAPIKIAVLPLSKKLSDLSLSIYNDLVKYFTCDFDDAGSIGKRYRRQDEIGTPFCVTIDFDSLTDNKITVRERDSMKQTRIDIRNIVNFFCDNIDR